MDVDPVMVPRARRRLVRELDAANLQPDVVADAALVLTELLTNALQHGSPPGVEEVAMCWSIAEDHVTISVADAGRSENLAPRPPNQDGEGGRGLTLVDQLCDAWTVDAGDGTRVVARLRRAGRDRSAGGTTTGPDGRPGTDITKEQS